MAEKDQPKEPPPTSAAAPIVDKAPSQDVEWPRLLARVVEGIVTAELHEFEDNVLAFLDSVVSDAYATFIWMCALVIGAGFIVTGLVLFLGIFLQWWAAFGLVGLLVIAMGALTRVGRRPRRRRRRKV
ncbi:MAG TPA: hypothetical protein VGR40_06545 [Candidatus Binatus sp.]|nr:hypothetical protein [Candidatus Binatus sp.]